MNVNNKNCTSIWINSNGNVEVIDQRYLPFEFKTLELNSVDEVCFAIKEMIIRGAPLIGVVASFGMYLAAKNCESDNNLVFDANKLKQTRPTAVNLQYAVDNQLKELIKISEKTDRIRKSFEIAINFRKEEIHNCFNIGKHGLEIIKEISKRKNGETVNILTHCNAGWLACVDYGTATAPIYLAFENNIKVHVWVDETRPRNQGARLTAWELGQHGIDFTLIPDNTGGHLMQHGMVDMVIVGSDRTTSNGDVANKIGTYLKALAAYDNNVPFYAALPASTIDWNLTDGIKQIPIETRNEDEVKYIEGFENNKHTKTLICNENVKVANYGFDVTPAKYVTGLITEKGICKANKQDIYKLFEKV
ncbi:MAG: S-methyl-5-thioribose-1-phosphate isomerase [Bacteroidetes bacterium GWA2_30_7]|nr:MAG: S-methyl-5-thioribose-1-phosphate isomerase [Bacteroidetes bacterium GWA2_30_7]